jgi:CTP synthase (UTP-ammonia lyase)
LIDVAARIHLRPETLLASAYGRTEIEEEYLCSYGVSAGFRTALAGEALREAAMDDDGDVRAVELQGHPFFVGTLFQPERAALKGVVPSIVAAFVEACAGGTPGLSPP